MATLGAEAMSNREAEVLDALGDHLTNAEIARKLHISVRTVESHVSSLLRKLGAADRRALAGLAPGLAAEAAAVVPIPSPGIAGLPNRWTSFVGRTEVLMEIEAALAESRLVTLLGPGGIGKTTLATTVAARHASVLSGGGAFVDLVPVGPDVVIEAVAAALGVVERPQEPLAALVHERLGRGRTLVVLDNCEHVLAPAAAVAHGVLAACPNATVLATSRERLGVAGERVVVVPPLALTALDGDTSAGEAEALFVDRATSASGTDLDPTLVAEICRRLDGMPLAIELAAARSASLGVDGLLAGLDDHLRLLSSSGGATERHRSLRAVIDWSHDLLDPEERVLFRRLAVFAGAFDLDAVAEVATDRDLATATDGVGRLADKSLLVHARDATGSRWRLLETVHAYALEQLDASGERAEVEHRHLHWAAGVAARIEALLDDSGDWQAGFDAVADDLRAALRVGRGAAAHDPVEHDLAFSLARLAYARRFFVEARHHFESAVARAPDERAAVAALLVWADAAFAEMRGELSFALLLDAGERAIAMGDCAVAASALAEAAWIGGRAPGTFADAIPHEDLVALVERARSLAPVDDLATATRVALAAAWNGHPNLTESDPVLAEQALALARELGDPVLISNALDCLGAAASSACHHKQTARLMDQRLALLDHLHRYDPRAGGEIEDIFHMATTAGIAAGELDAALRSATHEHGAIGPGLAHFAAAHLVLPMALQGAFDDALTQAMVMRDGWERSGRPAAGWMAPSFYAVALVHGLRGDDAGRDLWFELGDAVRQAQVNSFRLYVAPRIALHDGDLELAQASVIVPGEPVVGPFDVYAHAVALEVAVAARSPEAATLLAAARDLAPENDFVAGCVHRAAGVLHDDAAELEAAVVQWEAIGARFERACTLLLLPERRPEGEAELAALRCSWPDI